MFCGNRSHIKKCSFTKSTIDKLILNLYLKVDGAYMNCYSCSNTNIQYTAIVNDPYLTNQKCQSICKSFSYMYSMTYNGFVYF